MMFDAIKGTVQDEPENRCCPAPGAGIWKPVGLTALRRKAGVGRFEVCHSRVRVKTGAVKAVIRLRARRRCSVLLLVGGLLSRCCHQLTNSLETQF